MSKSKIELKACFKNGSRPTETHFADLIDSIALDDDLASYREKTDRTIEELREQNRELARTIETLTREMARIQETLVRHDQLQLQLDELKRAFEEALPFVVDPKPIFTEPMPYPPALTPPVVLRSIEENKAATLDGDISLPMPAIPSSSQAATAPIPAMPPASPVTAPTPPLPQAAPGIPPAKVTASEPVVAPIVSGNPAPAPAQAIPSPPIPASPSSTLAPTFPPTPLAVMVPPASNPAVAPLPSQPQPVPPTESDPWEFAPPPHPTSSKPQTAGIPPDPTTVPTAPPSPPLPAAPSNLVAGEDGAFVYRRR